MTFYPGEREKKIRAYMRKVLYGTYQLGTIEGWINSNDPAAAHPRTAEERAWAWEEIFLMEEERPELIRRPKPEPAEMLEFDPVMVEVAL